MRIVKQRRDSVKVGDRFGRIVVIGNPFCIGQETLAVGECDCGAVEVFRVRHIKHGAVQSCGCLSREVASQRWQTHCGTGTRLYVVWKQMRQRCANANNARYGGRGIRVCSEWEYSFEEFSRWAKANGYSDELQIDRIDNDGNYEPVNCRFVSRVTNANNKSNNTRIDAFGEQKTLAEWSRDNRCNVSQRQLTKRITLLGWSPEEAITKSVKCRVEEK